MGFSSSTKDWIHTLKSTLTELLLNIQKRLEYTGRSPGEGNGNPLQYSCLENSMDRGAWQAIVQWVT